MHPVDRRATSSQRAGTKRHAGPGWRIAGLTLCLAAVPIALAHAYDGRRMTLGANRPIDEAPAAAIPYDQAAALPTYPPLSRPAEGTAPDIAPGPVAGPAPAQAAADTAPIRVAPTGTAGDAARTAQAQAQARAPAQSPAASTPATPPAVATPAREKPKLAEAKRPLTETKVSAPGTKVATRDGNVRVDAPSAKVAVRDNGRVRVEAPGTRVAVDEGRVRVKAPFVDLDIRF